jgi:hypothetical protein
MGITPARKVAQFDATVTTLPLTLQTKEAPRLEVWTADKTDEPNLSVQ